MVARSRAAGPTVSKPSVIIVGSGAGGSVAAWALATRWPSGADLGEGSEPASWPRDAAVRSGRCSPTTRSRQGDTSRTRIRSSSRARAGRRPRPGAGVEPLVHRRRQRPANGRRRRDRSLGRQSASLLAPGLQGHGRSIGPMPGANVADWPLTYDDARAVLRRGRGTPRRPGRHPPRCRRARLPRRRGATSSSCRLTRRCSPEPCSPRARAAAVITPIRSRWRSTRVPHTGACLQLVRLLLWLRLSDQRARRRRDLVPARGASARRGAAHPLHRLPRRRRPATGVALGRVLHRFPRTASGPSAPTSWSSPPSAIETARLLLLSAGPASSTRARQPLRPGRAQPDVPLLHARHRPVRRRTCTPGAVRPRRSRSTTSSDPITGTAARAAGLPYLKGGICEVGGGVLLLEEAQLYTGLPNWLRLDAQGT